MDTQQLNLRISPRAAMLLVLSWLLASTASASTVNNDAPVLAAAAGPTLQPAAPPTRHQSRQLKSVIALRHGNGHRNRKRSEVSLQEWAVRERIRILGRYGPDQDEPLQRRSQVTEHRRQPRQVASSASFPPDVASFLSAAVATTLSSPTGLATATPADSPNIGKVNLTNWESDLEYYAPIHVGTPRQAFNVILDTGSADFWLVDSNCTTKGCNSTRTFNANQSSTALQPLKPFSIAYGSGTARGNLWNETVTLAGRSLTNQTIGLADSVGDTLIAGNASGIMGLGFPSLSATRTTPIWQNFLNMSVPAVDFSGFSFYFTRYINSTNTSHAEFGGLFTLGTLSNNSYSAPLNWIDVPPNTASYWVVPMQSLTLNGQNLTGMGTPNVAIDTGTTLVGGPAAVVEQLYTQIGGAYALDGAYEGFYTYPCNANISVGFQFGNVTYKMSAQDLNLGIFRDDQCLGAFFDLTLSSGSAQVISWVIGAAFLKNVYTAFRYSPGPSVGFANLSPAVLAIDNPVLPFETSASVSFSAPTGIFGGPTASVNGSSLPTGSRLPPGTTTPTSTSISAGVAANNQAPSQTNVVNSAYSTNNAHILSCIVAALSSAIIACFI